MVPSILRLLPVLLLTAPLPLPNLMVPNFPDLTIKTRRTGGNRQSTEETLYLKGARQRSEYVIQNAGRSMDHVSITQCDEKLRLNLNNTQKTYASFPIEDWATRAKRARPTPPPEMTGAEVTVTIHSVDTGERRKLGSHEIRRVKTTTKVEPGAGAVTQPSITEVDGWYIDLPGLSCRDPEVLGSDTLWQPRASVTAYRSNDWAQRPVDTPSKKPAVKPKPVEPRFPKLNCSSSPRRLSMRPCLKYRQSTAPRYAHRMAVSI